MVIASFLRKEASFSKLFLFYIRVFGKVCAFPGKEFWLNPKKLIYLEPIILRQFSSVAQSYPTLCSPMDCSTPGFPVHHRLPELLKLKSIKSVIPTPISSSVTPFSSCLQSFPASGSFPMSQFFASGGQSIRASALASVLPMNIQD